MSLNINNGEKFNIKIRCPREFRSNITSRNGRFRWKVNFYTADDPDLKNT